MLGSKGLPPQGDSGGAGGVVTGVNPPDDESRLWRDTDPDSTGSEQDIQSWVLKYYDENLSEWLPTSISPTNLIENPTKSGSINIEDGEDFQFTRRVPDGSAFEVYTWGAYNSDTGSVSNILIELVDGSGVAQRSDTTSGSQGRVDPIADLTNDTGSESTYKIRVTNNTGSTIGRLSFFAGFRVV
jgi:hypothetical protein